jgi:D-arabinose 1-dehydrogenase-like Zn-dependent alcohol dehydrogenase
MARMRVVQVAAPGGPLELVEREVPSPGNGEVRIRVEACGVCHSDSFTKEGSYYGIRYPIAPGHEVAGRIDAVGPGAEPWRVGQRVGVGWYGGHCSHCDRCRRGDFITCRQGRVPGITYDGGYADYMIAPTQALAPIPDELDAESAAPLLCAGITTFNALRNSGARAGDLVAVLGIGGLGHLALQFSARMGFDTVAIARGKDKAPLARTLGARRYLDSQTDDVAAELTARGGARVILATVTSAKAMTAVIDGLAVDGKLLVIGVSAEPIEVSPLQLIGRRASIQGWPAGVAADSEETLSFSALGEVRPMVESFPLEQAAAAYDRMISGAARFRVVLTMGD